jgi:hypothetical protein
VNAHCAPDYFNDTRIGNLGTPQNIGTVTLNSFNTSQQVLLTRNGGDQCLRVKGTLKAGVRLTIYTADDVCIEDNIDYAPWSIDTANYTNNAPYLAIVSTGNIYVENSVNSITGLFIAQPHDDGLGNVTGGAFTSCSNGSSFADANFVAANCRGQLNVKGSIIAQHIYPVRAHDTLLRYTRTGDTSEIFDYTPSIAVGQPNFASLCGGAGVVGCVDDTTILPPVF